MNFCFFRKKCIICNSYKKVQDLKTSIKHIGICNGCYQSLKVTGDMTFFAKGARLLISPFEYKGMLPEAVRMFKFNGQRKYGDLFGKMMGEELLSLDMLKDFDMIVPIPLHANRLKTRGYNQSKIISEQLSKNFNIPLRTDVLMRIKDTKKQSLFLGEERIENVRGAFLANRLEVCDRKIILVDDIYTMGETISSAACELLECGARDVIAVTLCKTVFKHYSSIRTL